MTKKNSVARLLLAAMVAVSANSAIAIECGVIRGTTTIRVANSNISPQMDAKVEGCPQGYDWNACCNVCGVFLQNNDKLTVRLTEGWTCAQGGAAGIWLRGCAKTNTCP